MSKQYSFYNQQCNPSSKPLTIMKTYGTIESGKFYNFNDSDLLYFEFLQNKYVNGKITSYTRMNNWEKIDDHNDFRRKFLVLLEKMWDKIKESQQLKTSNLVLQQKLVNLQTINSLIMAYLNSLDRQDFEQLNNILSSNQLKNYPDLGEKLNKFSLKLIPYQQMIQIQNQNRQKKQIFEVFSEAIQFLNKPTKWSQFFSKQQNWKVLNEKQKQKIKQYSIAQEQSSDFKDIISYMINTVNQISTQLQYSQINLQSAQQLASFCDKQNLVTSESKQLARNAKISLKLLCSKIKQNKKTSIISNQVKKNSNTLVQKNQWTYQLLKSFLAIISTDFDEAKLTFLQVNVLKDMMNDNNISQIIVQLKQQKNRLKSNEQFKRSIENMSLNEQQMKNIINTIQNIKQKHIQIQYGKIFSKSFLLKLLQNINTQKVSNSKNLIQHIINTCNNISNKPFIGQNLIINLKKLKFKQIKQQTALINSKKNLDRIQQYLNLNNGRKVKKYYQPSVSQFYVQFTQVCDNINRFIIENDQIKQRIGGNNKQIIQTKQIQLSPNNRIKKQQISSTQILQRNLNQQIEQWKVLKLSILRFFQLLKQSFQGIFTLKKYTFAPTANNYNKKQVPIEQFTAGKQKYDQFIRNMDNQIGKITNKGNAILDNGSNKSNGTYFQRTTIKQKPFITNRTNSQEIQNLNKQLNSIKQRLAQKQNQISLIRQFNTTNDQKIKQLSETIRNKQNQIKQKTNQFQIINQHYNSQAQILKRRNKQIQQLNNKIQAKNLEVERLNRIISNPKQEKFNSQIDKISQLNTQILIKNKKIEQLQKYKKQKEEEHKIVLNNKDKFIYQLQIQIDRLNNSKSNIQKELNSQQLQLKIVNNTLNDKNRRIQAMELLLKDKNIKLQQAQQTIKQILEKNQNQIKQINQLKRIQNQIRNSLKQIQDDKQKLQQKINNDQTQNKIKIYQINKLKEQIQTLNKQINVLKHDKQQILNNKTDKQNENNKLIKKINQLSNQNQYLLPIKTQYYNNKNQLQALRIQFQSSKIMNVQLQSKLKKINQQKQKKGNFRPFSIQSNKQNPQKLKKKIGQLQLKIKEQNDNQLKLNGQMNQIKIKLTLLQTQLAQNKVLKQRQQIKIQQKKFNQSSQVVFNNKGCQTTQQQNNINVNNLKLNKQYSSSCVQTINEQEQRWNQMIVEQKIQFKDNNKQQSLMSKQKNNQEIFQQMNLNKLQLIKQINQLKQYISKLQSTKQLISNSLFNLQNKLKQLTLDNQKLINQKNQLTNKQSQQKIKYQQLVKKYQSQKIKHQQQKINNQQQKIKYKQLHKQHRQLLKQNQQLLKQHQQLKISYKQIIKNHQQQKIKLEEQKKSALQAFSFLTSVPLISQNSKSNQTTQKQNISKLENQLKQNNNKLNVLIQNQKHLLNQNQILKSQIQYLNTKYNINNLSQTYINTQINKSSQSQINKSNQQSNHNTPQNINQNILSNFSLINQQHSSQIQSKLYNHQPKYLNQSSLSNNHHVNDNRQFIQQFQSNTQIKQNQQIQQNKIINQQISQADTKITNSQQIEDKIHQEIQIDRQFISPPSNSYQIHQPAKQILQQQKVNLQIENLKSKLNEYELTMRQLDQQKTQTNVKLINVSFGYNQVKQNLKNTKENNNKLSEDLKNKNAELNQLKNTYKLNEEKLISEISSKEVENKELNTKITGLETQIIKLNELVKQANQKVQPLEEIKNIYQSKIQEQEAKINALNTQKDTLRKTMKTQKQEAQKIKKQAQEQIKKCKLDNVKTLDEMKKQNNTLKYKIAIMEKSGGSDQRFGSDAQTSQLKMQNQKIKKDLQNMRKSSQLKDKELKQIKEQIQIFKKQIKEKNSQINKLQLEVKAHSKSLQLMTSKKSNSQNLNKQSQYILYDRFFAGDIMDGKTQNKFYLSNSIENQTYKRIKKTRLIYQFDLKNPTSFHSYIDGVSNFLIVVRTIKDDIFGAFSTSKFEAKSKESENTQSFIFSFIQTQKIQDPITLFPINYNKDKARSLQYDEYFLIVGNSQIRWRSGQKIIYSNFGINNGYFDTNGTNVWALLNAGDARQIEIKGFECYEIIFEN